MIHYGGGGGGGGGGRGRNGRCSCRWCRLGAIGVVVGTTTTATTAAAAAVVDERGEMGGPVRNQLPNLPLLGLHVAFDTGCFDPDRIDLSKEGLLLVGWLVGWLVRSYTN